MRRACSGIDSDGSRRQRVPHGLGTGAGAASFSARRDLDLESRGERIPPGVRVQPGVGDDAAGRRSRHVGRFEWRRRPRAPRLERQRRRHRRHVAVLAAFRELRGGAARPAHDRQRAQSAGAAGDRRHAFVGHHHQRARPVAHAAHRRQGRNRRDRGLAVRR